MDQARATSRKIGELSEDICECGGVLIVDDVEPGKKEYSPDMLVRYMCSWCHKRGFTAYWLPGRGNKWTGVAL